MKARLAFLAATLMFPGTDASAAAAWTPIGHSLQGRPLLAATSGSGPLRIYLVGGIHGDETEGRSALEFFKDTTHAATTIRILRDANPDGTAARRRGNADGVDLNRNWPAANFDPRHGGRGPLSEPETLALARDLREFRPHLVIVLHSMDRGPLVNYDGPGGRLAEAFVDAARHDDPRWRVEPDLGYPTPGSLGSWLGVDRQAPLLTVEFERGHDEAFAIAALRRGMQAVARAASDASQGAP